jgi:sensor histidine kinase YesM
MDPEIWFNTMTAKIDLLKKVEDHLASDLLTKAEDLAGDARSSLAFYFMITLSGLLITLGLTYLLCRDIRHSLAAVMEVVDNIADGDITRRIEHFPKNEMGVLAQSVNKMVGSLNDVFSSMLLSVKGLLLSSELLKERLGTVSERILKDGNLKAETCRKDAENLIETTEIARELERCISKMKYQVDALTSAAAEMRDSTTCFKIMKYSAHQAEIALGIASRTLPILREGLNYDTAAETAQIILEMTDLDAVQITDDSKILVHTGAEADKEYHKHGKPIISHSTKTVLSSGEIRVLQTKCDMGCNNYKCMLNSVITVPLKKGDGEVIGTLKLHRIGENGMSPLDEVLANGIAHLFSNQIELAEVENQTRLAREAEIRALHAQIKPHFIFNAINTIVNYVRTDPEAASGLLIKLAEFFRRNISPVNEKVPLSTEIEHCEAYLSIEKARFGDRVRINYTLDPETLNCMVPPLTLQPLVENALKHGILPDEEGGEIVIGSVRQNGLLKIFVKDNGIGMSAERIESLFSKKTPDIGCKGSGIALRNINARLTALYGCPLSIESTVGRGTTVYLTIPYHIQ